MGLNGPRPCGLAIDPKDSEIIKEMVNTAILMQKSKEVKPGKPTEDDDD